DCQPLITPSTLLQPAPSTPFPYTTLFRSRPPPRRHLPTHRPGDPPRRGRGHDARRPPARPLRTGVRRTRTLPHESRLALTEEPRDRKSTRLNSSHVKISYAVFCLKKKNNS